MRRVTMLMVAALFASACGGGSGSTGHDAGTTGDGTQTPTDSIQNTDTAHSTDTAVPPDGSSGACLVVSDFGTPTVGYDEAEIDADGTYYYGELNEDALPDVVSIELYAGGGPFPTTLTTGTFQLTGAELQLSTCSACVLVYADVPETGEPPQTLMATGGTLTLTSVTGHLSGTLSNVTFQHVAIDDNTGVSTPVNDGCTTRIGSLSFDSVIVVADGGT
jgi:hypothetical protein